MKRIKYILTSLLLFVGISIFAANGNVLLLKAHHPKDKNTIIRIWKTPKNEYIIRTSYSLDKDDFDQEKLTQYQKKVEYDGFAKRVTFKTSDDSYYVIAYVSGEYALVFGFYSEALNNIGLIYEKKTDYAKAKFYFSKAYMFCDTNKVYKKNLDRIMEKK